MMMMAQQLFGQASRLRGLAVTVLVAFAAAPSSAAQQVGESLCSVCVGATDPRHPLIAAVCALPGTKAPDCAHEAADRGPDTAADQPAHDATDGDPDYATDGGPDGATDGEPDGGANRR